MEWVLPIQKVEIGNINIGSPLTKENFQNKPLAPLSYFGTQFRMTFLSLLFPPLPIIEYSNGRLVLDMSSTSLGCIKLNTFQETLINAIAYHQGSWFKSDFSKEVVKEGFQPIIENNQIILYCPSNARNIPFYKDKAWNSTFTTNDLKPGVKVRVSIKIHGISFLPLSDGSWSGKCRLQHRIQGILVQA